MKLRLLKRAERDLAGIRDYIEAHDPKAADAVATRLVHALNLIAARPQIGRPTSRPAVWEWSVSGLPYVIPYRVGKQHIEVLRIWHTSRNRPIH